MRARTFILLILVLLVAAVAVILVVTNLSGGGIAGLLGGEQPEQVEEGGEEPGLPTPTPTPASQPVVVAKVRLPVGEILTADVLDIEMRPITNIALQGGYTFTDTQQLVGRIVKAEIARGQEILSPMIALNPTDVAAFGSDLSLYVPQGQVAVALPVDRFSGASLAMRPGDHIDVVMTLRAIEIDPTFRSALPNQVERVIESALVRGQAFLFPPVDEGRLEFIPEINQVAAIVPGGAFITTQDWVTGDPVPKRVTQLTIQQATVIYVGQWIDPRRLEREQEAAQAGVAATQQAVQGGGTPVPIATPTPIPSRLDPNPGMVIISMSAQDALVLKYAREREVQIDLVLRAPGDQTQFVTTSVSLPQIIDQGGLAIPEPSDVELFNPRIDPTRAITTGSGEGTPP
jgi:Flp pilus assembly protein CpaB